MVFCFVGSTPPPCSTQDAAQHQCLLYYSATFFFSLPGSKKVKIKGHIVHRTDNLRVWSYITFFYSSFLKASSIQRFFKIYNSAGHYLSLTNVRQQRKCLFVVCCPVPMNCCCWNFCFKIYMVDSWVSAEKNGATHQTQPHTAGGLKIKPNAE